MKKKITTKLFSFMIAAGAVFILAAPLHGQVPDEGNMLKITDSPFYPREGNPSQLSVGYRNTENEDRKLSVEIYDTEGYRVKSLIENSDISVSQTGLKTWDGYDDYGDRLPIGIYIVYMELECEDGGGVKTAADTAVLGRRF